MNRNFHISKETQDKVKLAKQYVESKYQAILQEEHKHKLGWQRIMKALADAPIPEAQKKIVAKKALVKEASQIRLLRARDKLSNYQLLEMIGKGAFGDVRLAKIKDTGMSDLTIDEVVAIKRMGKEKLADKRQVSSVFLQREFLSRNKSGWLVELRSAFQDESYLYIAMEWVPGGDLLKLLIDKGIFTQSQTKFYVAQLILAIEDMHKMHYIHRDIKPDNILIDSEGHLKLTDFGLSKHLTPKPKTKINQRHQRDSTKPRTSLKKFMVPRQRHFSKVGTPDYIAPEVLTDQTYDHRVDIWSVGVIMFECLFGYPLFSHEDSKEVCQRVMNWEEYLVFPDTPKVSLEAKLLILGMLSSYESRLSISQIKSHPFFDDFNWQGLKSMTPPFVPTLSHDLDTHNFDTFDDCEEWVSEERRIQRKSCEVRNSCMGYQYNFAGFDWQPRPQNSALASTLKQIQSLGKRKTVSPHHQFKRFKTQTCQQENIPTSSQHKLIRHSLKMYEKSKKEDRGLKKIGLNRKL